MIFQQILNEESGCLSYLIGCGEAGRAIIVDPGRDRVADYLRLARKKGLTISARGRDAHPRRPHLGQPRPGRGRAGADPACTAPPASPSSTRTSATATSSAIGNRALQDRCTRPATRPTAICLLVTDRRPRRGALVRPHRRHAVRGLGGTPRSRRRARGGGHLGEPARACCSRSTTASRSIPAHGAGSACGRAMSAKSGSTIGFERRFNPALQLRDRAAFVDFLMEDLPPKPPSFETIVGKNKGLISAAGRQAAAVHRARGVGGGAARARASSTCAIPGATARCTSPGAVNVWIESPQFAERVAGHRAGRRAAAPHGRRGPSDLDRAVQALSRVGVDEISGFLQWGMIEWRSEGFPVETVPQITASRARRVARAGARRGRDRRARALRVARRPHRAARSTCRCSRRRARRGEVPADRPKAVLCAGGLRSSTAISALKRHGIEGWYNVTGGMTAWKRFGYPVVRSSSDSGSSPPRDDGRASRSGASAEASLSMNASRSLRRMERCSRVRGWSGAPPSSSPP